MYVHDLWCKCITSRDANDLVRSQKFLFDLFLSPVNWTVQNLRKKHKLLSGSMEPDTVWFDSVWRYFLPAAGQKPSRLLFTSMAPRARQCFFSPSAAFSGDQCYYWVGSNYCTGFFFFLPPVNWISTENWQRVCRRYGKVRLQNNNSSSRAGGAGGERSTAIKSLSFQRREVGGRWVTFALLNIWYKTGSLAAK